MRHVYVILKWNGQRDDRSVAVHTVYADQKEAIKILDILNGMHTEDPDEVYSLEGPSTLMGF